MSKDLIILFLFIVFLVLIYLFIFKKRPEIQKLQSTQEEEETEKEEVVPEPTEEEEAEKEEVVPEPTEEEEAEKEEVISKPTKEKKPKKTSRKRERRDPFKRGGGRFHDNGKNKEEKVGQPRPYQSRPEIVCWQRERVWYVGVEVPEEIIGKNLKIYQNGITLTQDEFDECLWVLKESNVPVEIKFDEKVEYSIPLNKERLIFKLSGSDLSNGCYIKSPSFGYYLVITPKTWKRDVDISGPPPISPQPVSFSGYQGHFFNIIKYGDKKIAFRNEKNDLILIESEEARFEIIGNVLNDYNESLGPIFGEGFIHIKSLNSRGWADVSTLVIGEEGRGRGKWRTEFIPRKNKLDQELPNDVMSRRGGWYFIRFYDMNTDLIESLDFRFISGLYDISVIQPSMLPSEEGHNIVQVEFSHDSNYNITPKFKVGKGLEITHKTHTTTITIPPRDDLDVTTWNVGPHNGPLLDINILIERIWWGIGEEEIPPLNWLDKPLTLSREDFAPTSNKAIYLKFPRPRWIKNDILVGFEKNRAQSYNILVDEKTVVIPLRSFGDASEVENEDTEALFKIWISRDNEAHECIIALLPSNIKSESQEDYSSVVPISVGYGRKRRAIAKAMLFIGSPQIIVNNNPLWEYFEFSPKKAKRFMQRLLQIDEVSKTLLNFQVQIIIKGSGPNTMQQAKAATHALARALMNLDPDLDQRLKQLNDFGGVRLKESQKKGV